METSRLHCNDGKGEGRGEEQLKKSGVMVAKEYKNQFIIKRACPELVPS